WDACGSKLMATRGVRASTWKPSVEADVGIRMTSRLCPICGRPLSEEAEAARVWPFCFRRCADVDLGRWLKGAYAIPAVELDDETETEPSGMESEAHVDGDSRAGGRRPRVRH